MTFYFQSVLTIGIGILAAIKLKGSNKLKENSRMNRYYQNQSSKMERHLYITVVIMQVGFTITLCKILLNFIFQVEGKRRLW